MQEQLNQRLDHARRDLLDLGLRNTLLNYQHLRSRGAELTGADPAEVFRLLVTDGRALALRPTEPPPPAPPPQSGRGGAAPESAVDTEPPPEATAIHEKEEGNSGWEGAPSPAPRGRDGVGATSYSPEQLQTRLLNTYYTARTFLEEQGVNILYIALGLLEWSESEPAETVKTVRKAPLILVPVEISRSDVRSQFRLRHTGEEVGDNLSLRMKLEQDFGIKLPELPEEEIAVEAVEEYFRAVGEAVASRTGWRVDGSAVVLGFFSFSKLLMYRDLDPRSWPAEAQPGSHPLLQSLLADSFHEAPPALGEEDHLDRRVDPGALHPVVDADSSQTLAILDVLHGRNLVVQGPPGTGKSQTITNLIAEAVAADKKVLFVAEKMAALEVVKRNLDKIGLGFFALELHSHKTNKRQVLEELRRTLALGSPIIPQADADLAAWRSTRDRLNAYCDAVNDEIGTSGVRPHDAFGLRLRLDARLAPLAPPPLRDETMAGWSAADFRRREALTAELQGLIATIGLLAGHPFFGSRVLAFRSDVASLSRAASDALATELAAASRLAGLLGLAEPSDLATARRVEHAGQTVAEAPDLRGLDLTDSGWTRSDLPDLLSTGATLTRLHTEHDPLLLESAWTEDVLASRKALAHYGPKWWRFFSGPYRKARQQIAGLFRSAPPKEWMALLRTADALLEAQGLARKLQEGDLLARLFHDRWTGLRSNWEDLSRVASFLSRVHAELAENRLPAEIFGVLERPVDASLPAATRELGSALDRSGQATAAILAALDLDEPKRCGGGTFAALPFPGQEAAFRAWAEHAPRLQDIVAVNHLTRRMAGDGLAQVISAAEAWPAAGQALVDLLHRAWLTALLERAERERPELAAFHGSQQTHAVETFRRLDAQTLLVNRARLARHHWERIPRDGAAGQIGTLRREFEKKRRHLPIRQLMSQAGRAVQTLKPVFLMSPLSVASYLPPGGVQFDLVIFDEASQVRPVDALGALLRGGQAVVVGDSQQLPPTTFFDKLTEPGGDEEDDDAPADLESVLGLFRARGAPERTLRWHYRSRHESLIAVSNRLFYEDRLVVFPSPDLGREARGLVFHHLPDTFYEPGTSRRRNRGEAQAVARAVLEHARTRPELSLGVAAFNLSQAQAILEEVELLRRQDPSCEPFFAAHPEEPFFVKNLENVQGDERDVIFISVGYGRTQDGSLSHNFGPLNQEGGQRRLNVLISRAKHRCEVFANFTADDLDPARTSAAGVAALKTYLEVAARRGTAAESGAAAPVAMPFADQVAATLRGRGYEIRERIGVAGYFLDLAVVDPERPGHYLLGIECDGPNYRSARSARDRERLRPEVLGRLGWRLHRIWSPDWFRDPEGELRRLLEALERAQAEARDEAPARPAPPPPPPSAVHLAREETPATTDEPPAVEAPPYQKAEIDLPKGGPEIHTLPLARVAGWIHQVVQVESPVHFEEIAERITEALGIARVGPRIRKTLESAAKLCRSQGVVKIDGDFLWLPEMTTPPVRDRSGLPADQRRIEWIAREEIREAVRTVVQASAGITVEHLPTEVSRLLGWARITKTQRVPIEAVIREMVEAGGLRAQGEFLLPG
jgi:very-short-patch-repair endonuclease